MERIGARELKQHTGEIIARVRRGERMILTYHGHPIAIIAPLSAEAFERALNESAHHAEASTLEWLGASEAAFDFWNNAEDDVWDEGEAS